MYYFRVTIAYKGTRYFGWQAQSTNTRNEEKPTIEGTLRNALGAITKHQACTVSCASRTDGGVHAQGQVAKIALPIAISADHLLLGLNSLLPTDIRILSCECSSKAYQPNRNNSSKEYHYYFSVSSIDNAVMSDIAIHYPKPSNAFDPALMREACKLFVGKHDFKNFSGRDKEISSTIREVFHCEILPANFLPLASNLFYLKIVGDGFLKHMVRYIAGALLALDKERISLTDISVALEAQCETKLSPKAKSKGLHLIHIAD